MYCLSSTVPLKNKVFVLVAWPSQRDIEAANWQYHELPWCIKINLWTFNNSSNTSLALGRCRGSNL